MHVTSMTAYMFALFIKHKLHIVTIILFASVITFSLHNPTRTVTRSILALNSIVNPELTTTIENKKFTEREGYIAYLRSYDFFHSVAKEIYENKSYHELKRQLLRTKTSKDSVAISHIAETLKKITTIQGNGETNIQIEVEGKGKNFSSAVAGIFSEMGIQQLLNKRLVDYVSMRDSAYSQLNKIQEEFDALNLEIINYKNENNLLSTQTIPEDLRNSISNLTRSKIDAEIQLKETNFLIKSLNARIKSQEVLIHSTQGQNVTYRDQVMDEKLQELTETKNSLKGKIEGLNKIIIQETSKYKYVAVGEERLNLFQSKRNIRLEQLNQLELKLKHIEALGTQIKNAFKVEGSPYVVRINKATPLVFKLPLIIFAVLLIACMAVFYWYEVFPVLHSRESEEGEIGAIPWMGSSWKHWPLPHIKDVNVRARIQQMTAQKILERMPRPGLYQIVSGNKGEGKSFLTVLLARELIRKNHKVAIISLNPSPSYVNLPKGVQVHVIRDAKNLESFIEQARSLSFAEDADDWIFIDSGALNTNVGHLLISPYMDGIILVGSYLQTSKERFIGWQRRIEHIAGKKAVFVLNKTDINADFPFLLTPASSDKKPKKTDQKAS